MRTILNCFGFVVRSAHSQSKNNVASPIKTMPHGSDTPIRSQSDSDFHLIANLAKFCCSGGMGCMRYTDVKCSELKPKTNPFVPDSQYLQ